jgi:hypothetical protein
LEVLDALGSFGRLEAAILINIWFSSKICSLLDDLKQMCQRFGQSEPWGFLPAKAGCQELGQWNWPWQLAPLA